MATASKQPLKHTGSCHCGAVRFEVQIDATEGTSCNCTVCTKIAGVYGMTKPDAFRLLSGEQNLSFYEWGVCVALNVLDDIDPAGVRVGYWDGRHDNWQAGMRDKPWPIGV